MGNKNKFGRKATANKKIIIEVVPADKPGTYNTTVFNPDNFDSIFILQVLENAEKIIIGSNAEAQEALERGTRSRGVARTN